MSTDCFIFTAIADLLTPLPGVYLPWSDTICASQTKTRRCNFSSHIRLYIYIYRARDGKIMNNELKFIYCKWLGFSTYIRDHSKKEMNPATRMYYLTSCLGKFPQRTPRIVTSVGFSFALLTTCTTI